MFVVVFLACCSLTELWALPASTLKYPFVVRILKSQDERVVSLSSGVIIDDNTIVTAAGRVAWEEPESLSVLAGVSGLITIPFGVEIKVKEVIAHPRYLNNSNTDFDIAILELAGNLKFQWNVGPAVITEQENEDKQAIALGWGVNPVISDLRGIQLSATEVALVPQDQCEDLLQQKTDTLVCFNIATDNLGFKEYPFDYGSPITSKTNEKELIGIFSSPEIGGILHYIKISPFSDWIQENKGV